VSIGASIASTSSVGTKRINPKTARALLSEIKSSGTAHSVHLSHGERSAHEVRRVRGCDLSIKLGPLTPALSPTGRGSSPPMPIRLQFNDHALGFLYCARAQADGWSAFLTRSPLTAELGVRNLWLSRNA
jgi:hypothetical protein